jgi:hypothetical protein
VAGEREGDGTVRDCLEQGREALGICAGELAGVLLRGDKGNQRVPCGLGGGGKFLRAG